MRNFYRARFQKWDGRAIWFDKEQTRERKATADRLFLKYNGFLLQTAVSIGIIITAISYLERSK